MWTWIVANRDKLLTAGATVAAASAGLTSWTDAGRALLAALGLGVN